MAKSLPHRDHLVEEDYIDMDIGPSDPPPSCTAPHPLLLLHNILENLNSKCLPTREIEKAPPPLPMSSSTKETSSPSNASEAPRAKPPDTFEKKMPATSSGYVISGDLDIDGEDYLFQCSIGLLQSNPDKSRSVQEARVDRALISGSQAEGIPSLPQVDLSSPNQAARMGHVRSMQPILQRLGKRNHLAKFREKHTRWQTMVVLLLS